MRLTKTQAKLLERKLINRGYRKYRGDFKMSDYVYWKPFKRDEDRNKGYQIGIAFYDYSSYIPMEEDNPLIIGVSYTFMLGNDMSVSRLDVDISDDKVTLEQVEKFSEEFYEFFITQKTITDENQKY